MFKPLLSLLIVTLSAALTASLIDHPAADFWMSLAFIAAFLLSLASSVSFIWWRVDTIQHGDDPELHS